jgi:hypothetical protein
VRPVVVLALAFVSAAVVVRTPTGVLHGVVTRGPITPVCSTAQPCYAPVPGAKIVFLRNGRPVAHTTTRGDGSYRIRLAGGRYGIRLPGYRRWTPLRVLVQRGRAKRLDISIDTGIR